MLCCSGVHHHLTKVCILRDAIEYILHLLKYILRMQQLECQLLTEIADLRLGAASQVAGGARVPAWAWCSAGPASRGLLGRRRRWPPCRARRGGRPRHPRPRGSTRERRRSEARTSLSGWQFSRSTSYCCGSLGRRRWRRRGAAVERRFFYFLNQFVVASDSFVCPANQFSSDEWDPPLKIHL